VKLQSSGQSISSCFDVCKKTRLSEIKLHLSKIFGDMGKKKLELTSITKKLEEIANSTDWDETNLKQPFEKFILMFSDEEGLEKEQKNLKQYLATLKDKNIKVVFLNFETISSHDLTIFDDNFKIQDRSGFFRCIWINGPRGFHRSCIFK
jgi:hypothetical protein